MVSPVNMVRRYLNKRRIKQTRLDNAILVAVGYGSKTLREIAKEVSRNQFTTYLCLLGLEGENNLLVSKIVDGRRYYFIRNVSK